MAVSAKVRSGYPGRITGWATGISQHDVANAFSAASLAV